jgi:hypothetical protein
MFFQVHINLSRNHIRHHDQRSTERFDKSRDESPVGGYKVLRSSKLAHRTVIPHHFIREWQIRAQVSWFHSLQGASKNSKF